MFKPREINNRADWEALVSRFNAQTTFTQSWNWGEFNNQQGDRIERWALSDGDELLGLYQAFFIHAKRGYFMFIPHGPLLTNWHGPAARQVFKHLEERARVAKASFIRISPYLHNDAPARKIFKGFGYISSPIHMHAELTWVLDITPQEATLLRGMRKSTRYEISRILRTGVKVTRHTDPAIIDQVFWPLFKETSARQSFVPFSNKYLTQELAVLGASDEAMVFVAWHEQRPLAAALVIFYQGVAYYHQGASVAHEKRLPGAPAVQWAAINEARRRGFKIYNFWGIHPSSRPNHPWRGTTFFKQGFGGRALPLLHAQDKPLRPGYWLTYGFETLRRFKRGL